VTADKDLQNLSGFWTGVYDYPAAHREPVPFNAVIEDVAGALHGEIIEPNTFSKARDRELFASITGSRDGNAVRFVKTYERVSQGGHSLVYQGTLDGSGTRIDGMWRAHALWSGPFVMNRSTGKTATIENKAERAVDLVKPR
jgi:hypothetical protein